MSAFLTYPKHDSGGPLEDWPFEAPDSNYKILRGPPRASGRLDAGGPGHTTRVGIWRCTVGAFCCTEQGDELITVLSGRCSIFVHDTKQTIDLTVGDTAFLRDGVRGTWTIHEDVVRVFFGHKASGY